MLDDWLNPGINDPAIREDARKFILGIDPQQTEQAARDLEDFASPTLFAWAPEDRWFKVAHADSLAAAMPDARVVRVPDAKTFVSIDQPDRLAEEIASFVRATKSTAVAA